MSDTGDRNEMDDRLRDSLERRADDVRPHREVPPGLGRRAGRRVAMNSVALGAMAVVAVAGIVLGVRAFTPDGGGGVGHSPTSGPVPTATSPTTTTPQPTPSSASTQTSGAEVSACTPGQLRANGTLEGAAGSREGEIDFANFSDTACTLQDRPGITLLESPGHPITSGVTFMDTDAAWQVNDEQEPDGWPVVTLQPGDTASIRIRWGNWCPQGRAAPLWQVDLPGGGSVPVTNGMEEPPPCNGEGVPSTIEVGPFEPAR